MNDLNSWNLTVFFLGHVICLWKLLIKAFLYKLATAFEFIHEKIWYHNCNVDNAMYAKSDFFQQLSIEKISVICVESCNIIILNVTKYFYASFIYNSDLSCLIKISIQLLSLQKMIANINKNVSHTEQWCF